MTNKSEKEKNADYFVSKGREYFNAKNYDLAIECFNKALLLVPDHAWGLAYKGEALFRKGDAKSGIEFIKKALIIKQKKKNFIQV